jgi:coatomer subunit beta
LLFFTSQEHRHSFVRKNAVFAVYSIYQAFDYLIPDAPELVQTFLTAESDLTCKRNAFIMLVNTSPVRAIEYLVQIYEQISSMDGLMQQAVIELIRKDREGKGEGGKEELKVIVGGMKVCSSSCVSVTFSSLISSGVISGPIHSNHI